MNDADIEAVRKAIKKSAFNRMAQQGLKLVKTDFDTKTKKKRHKKHDDEDELAKLDKQTINADEIRDVELATWSLSGRRWIGFADAAAIVCSFSHGSASF